MLDLSPFPRLRFLDRPTPIEPLDNINRALDGVRIYVKRDDTGGIGLGGNKLRKLEFLLGAARAEGADTVITVGGLQSNHARLTAAAAARAGLRCDLFLTRTVPRSDPDYTTNGNLLLDDLFGANVHQLPGSDDSLAATEARAADLRADGRRAYVFPSGGSSPVGCLGYAACAEEIVQQEQTMDLSFTQVVTANGSAGTHAGLAAGFSALGRDATLVKSFAVLADEGKARAEVLEKGNATLDLLGAGTRLSAADIRVDGSERGEGYGIPTAAMVDAVRLVARTEGRVLDPVYSGKAFAGLLRDVRQGRYRRGATILFLMTGGSPGLFAYRPVFAASPR